MQDIKVTVVKYKNCKNLLLRYINPMTGKQKHKTAGTSNRREAERAAAKWEAELQAGIANCGKVSWADFRTRYENEVLASLAESTDKKVRGVFNTVEKYLSPQRLRDLTAERLSYMQSKLRDEKRSEDTIKGHMAHLLSALNWAVSMGLLVKAPEVKMPKRAKSAKAMKGRPITGEEFERMLDKVHAGLVDAEEKDSDRPKTRITEAALARYRERHIAKAREAVPSWQHLLKGLWLSGLRIGEALELCWDRDDRLCVDLQAGEHPMLRIPAELEKGNQDRLLPMAPEFAEFLLETPEEERTGYVFKPMPQRSERTSRLSAGQVIRTIAKIGEKAGIKVKVDAATGKVKYASAHDLRRSFGLRWASRVMPQVLMELMRHESIDTTMRYYVGRNAQSTAAVLWEAHNASLGKQTGKQASHNAKQPGQATRESAYPG